MGSRFELHSVNIFRWFKRILTYICNCFLASQTNGGGGEPTMILLPVPAVVKEMAVNSWTPVTTAKQSLKTTLVTIK